MKTKATNFAAAGFLLLWGALGLLLGRTWHAYVNDTVMFVGLLVVTAVQIGNMEYEEVRPKR